MKRRGFSFLPENVFELFFTGIILAALFFTGIFIYNTFFEKNDQRNAQRFLDSFIGKYDALQEGQNNTFIFQGFRGGENWYLLGWSQYDRLRPQKCFLHDCLCLCKGGPRAEVCQTDGFCRNLSVPPVVRSETFLCTTTTSLPLKYLPGVAQGDYSFNNNVVLYRRTMSSPFVQLSSRALGIRIEKAPTELRIGSSDDSFFGSVDMARISTEERNRRLAFISQTHCDVADPYKAVFTVQTSFKGKLVLDTSYYKEKYGLDEVIFEFIND